MQINQVSESIDIGRVVPFFQPIVDLTTSRVVGYECLARLIKSDEQYFLPAQFLNIVEKERCSGQLAERIFSQSAEYFSTNATPWGMNVCIEDIQDGQFLTFLHSVIRYYRTPGKVTLEVKALDAVEHTEAVQDFSRWCQQRGIHFVLDRFVISPASMALLDKLHLDGIKLDGDTIRNYGRQQTPLPHLNELKTQLQQSGCMLIAEHVETAELADFIRDAGIRYGQGFYFSRPAASINPS